MDTNSQAYLDEMNAELIAMGLKPVSSLEQARKPINTTAEIPEDGVRTRYAKPGQQCGRGVVRLVSAKQVAFIKSLMAQRDTRNLVRLPGSEDIEKMSLAGARDLIERLLGCPEIPALVAQAQMASEAQMTFINSLLEQREYTLTIELDGLTKKAATALIAELKEAPYKAKTTTVAEDIKTLAGLYELEGEIYRMKKARTGQHFYAELLTDAESGAWEYARGMAKKVPAEGRKLTLAEGEALSLKLGGCCCCGRTLTATVDGVGPAARFIGPVCAAKYF